MEFVESNRSNSNEDELYSNEQYGLNDDHDDHDDIDEINDHDHDHDVDDDEEEDDEDDDGKGTGSRILQCSGRNLPSGSELVWRRYVTTYHTYKNYIIIIYRLDVDRSFNNSYLKRYLDFFKTPSGSISEQLLSGSNGINKIKNEDYFDRQPDYVADKKALR